MRDDQRRQDSARAIASAARAGKGADLFSRTWYERDRVERVYFDGMLAYDRTKGPSDTRSHCDPSFAAATAALARCRCMPQDGPSSPSRRPLLTLAVRHRSAARFIAPADRLQSEPTSLLRGRPSRANGKYVMRNHRRDDLLASTPRHRRDVDPRRSCGRFVIDPTGEGFVGGVAHSRARVLGGVHDQKSGSDAKIVAARGRLETSARARMRSSVANCGRDLARHRPKKPSGRAPNPHNTQRARSGGSAHP